MSKVVIEPSGLVVNKRAGDFVARDGAIEVPIGPVLPHLQLRVAWAYGAVIETKVDGNWINNSTPAFNPSYEYRIKPDAKAEEISSIRKEMDKLASRLKELE